MVADQRCSHSCVCVLKLRRCYTYKRYGCVAVCRVFGIIALGTQSHTQTHRESTVHSYGVNTQTQIHTHIICIDYNAEALHTNGYIYTDTVFIYMLYVFDARACYMHCRCVCMSGALSLCILRAYKHMTHTLY